MMANYRTNYKVFEIKIWNAKKEKTEYRDYAIFVTPDADGDREALEAATAYAQSCIARYRSGSTFTVTEQ